MCGRVRRPIICMFVRPLRTDAFSNKYRLLGDYIDLLRRELGMTRLELAEDIKERHEDHPILKR